MPTQTDSKSSPLSTSAMQLLSEQYWLLSEPRVKDLFRRISKAMSGTLELHVDADRQAYMPDGTAQKRGFEIREGVAIIQVVGALSKYPDWADQYYGLIPTTSIKAQIEETLESSEVTAILLHIDCPGGAVNGTIELAQAVRDADKIKPVYAFISGLAASGGYYLASQCRKIFAAPGSEVGCIGVYCVLMDVSQYWAEIGVQFTLVGSGKFKGLGADGKVTEDLIADQQRIVDSMKDQFVADVAAGRELSLAEVSAVADGRCWLTPEALDFNLIDEVASFDAAFQSLTDPDSGQESSPMGKQNETQQGNAAAAKTDATKKAADEAAVAAALAGGGKNAADGAVDTTSDDYKAGYDAGYANGHDAGYAKCQGEGGDEDEEESSKATIEQLKAAFPSREGFVIDQLGANGGKGATLLQAKAAFAVVLAADLETTRAENAKLRTEIKGLNGGVEPVQFTAGTDTEAAGGSPAPTDAEGIEAKAKANWKANVKGCRARFVSEKVFINIAKREPGIL
jgi:signal peptide peptidase SppA